MLQPSPLVSLSVLSFLGVVSLTSSAPVTRTGHGALNVTALVVFGDSFSDNGSGIYALSNHTWPLDQYGYYQGRFSNGPVWPEYLANNLSVPLHDYAYGGATTSNTIIQGYSGNGSTIPVPSVDEQVAGFLANVPTGLDINSTLFAVTGGANDVFFDGNASAWTAVSIIAQQISKLEKVGARHFILFNYYDFSQIPYDSYIEPELKKENRQYSVDLQRALSKLHNATPGSYFFSLAEDLAPRLYFYGEPTKYGLDQYGAYGSCLTGVYKETSSISRCPEPNKRVYWDEYHPSSRVHALIAEGILDRLHKH